jgi:hypothetical protein
MDVQNKGYDCGPQNEGLWIQIFEILFIIKNERFINYKRSSKSLISTKV